MGKTNHKRRFHKPVLIPRLNARSVSHIAKQVSRSAKAPGGGLPKFAFPDQPEVAKVWDPSKTYVIEAVSQSIAFLNPFVQSHREL